jgi:hypothetical protein
MPAVTRWYIKAGLAYLVVALLLGMMLVAPAVVPLPPAIVVWGPLYFHLLMVGWVTQLIFGVVYWMFPRYSREKPRGHEGLAVATFILLNLGLVLRAIGEPVHSLWPAPTWGGLVALSAILQWVAGMLFVINTWARVKER